MKRTVIILIFSCTLALAQQHEAPMQLLPFLRSHIDTKKCLKVIADPCCVPTVMVACLAHNACNLPYPCACAVGAGTYCSCLAWAIEGNDTKLDYYSVKAFAALKNSFFAIFPCMQTAQTVTDKID